MLHEGAETHFASTARYARQEMDDQLRSVASEPLVDALLKGLHGLLAVLSPERQILAVNDNFLASLGLPEGAEVLGLRPGEALDCVHAHEMPAGCGTSRYCSTCGAALSIVAALAAEGPQERKCVLTVTRKGRIETLCFAVRATLFDLHGERLVLLWMQDVSQPERWAMLERAFFHDIANLASALGHTAEFLRSPMLDPKGRRELTDTLHTLTTRLSREIDIQRRLTAVDAADLKLALQTVRVREILKEVSDFCHVHPMGKQVRLEIDGPVPELSFVTDLAAVLRVLSNMLVNALEASSPGDAIRLKVEKADGRLIFSVWNRQPIPPDVARRIFEYHFSTKPGAGRGLGTFAMRILGQEILGGNVDFLTSEADGTVFMFSHPLPFTSVPTLS